LRADREFDSLNSISWEMLVV